MRSILLLLLLYALPASLFAQMTGRAASSEVRRETRLRTDSIVANGVDTGTGAFIAERTIVDLQGVRDLSLTIAYNSLLTSGGVVGPGWGHEYEAFITGDFGGTVVVHWDAVRENRFRFVDGSYEGIDDSNRYDRLTRVGGLFRVRTFDGTEYRFDEDGRLIRLSNKVNQRLEMTYEDDLLTKIVEPASQREIDLFYVGGGCSDNPFTTARCPIRLHHIRDQADRVMFFSYDENFRLSAWRDPATLSTEVYPEFAPSVLRPIPDNDPNGLTFTQNVDRRDEIGLMFFRSFAIGHPRPADLEIQITSPSGTVGSLTTNRAQPNWILSQVVVDFFDGEDPFGTWRFRIIDRVAGESGSLESFGMSFTGPTNPYPITYNSQAQIVQIHGPDGERVVSNAYDGQGRVVIQDDGRDDNEIVSFSWNETVAGVEVAYTDRMGVPTVFEHDRGYNLTKITDALGREIDYTYDNEGNRTSITDELGRRTTYTYDSEGNLTSSTDPVGATTRYRYDSNNQHNLITITDPGHTPQDPKVTSFQYDGSSNVRRITDAEGNRDNKTYGANSILVGSLLEDGAGIGMGYSGGLLSRVDHPVQGESSANYDAIGWMTEVTDGDGFTRTTRYSSRGDVLERTDPEDNLTRNFYDRRGRKVRTIAPNGGINRFTYDGNGNIMTVTDALGQVTSYDYDGEDRVVSITDPAGGVRQFEYDELGRRIVETDELGDSIRMEYDAVGNLLAIYDAKGVKVESVTYDDRGLPIRTEGPLGSVVESTFDIAGRLTRIVDPMGRETIFEYDQLDRETAFEDALGRRSGRTYFADDATASMDNPGGFNTTFTYDGANRMTGITYPWQRSMRIRYNDRDLVDQVRFPSQKQLDFEYTPNGNISTIERTDEPDLEYSYDESDNLTRVADSTGTELGRYRYDVLNRLTAYTDPRGDQLSYSYDEAGNLSRIVYPDGKRVDYSYDVARQLTEVEDWAGRITSYEYDANGSITRIELPNGTVREMTYDSAGQVTERRDVDAQGLPIVSYRYVYDAAGQAMVERGRMGPAPFRQRPVAFTFGSNTLLETYDGIPVTHDFDGNVTSFGTVDLRYDTNGNLTQANRIFAQNGANNRFEYDGEDRLIAIDSTQLTINPLPDLSQIMVSRAGSDLRRYVWGVGLIYEETPGGIRVHHYDHRGSTVAITDDSGDVVGRASYGPYGELGEITGETGSLFGFHSLFGVVTGPKNLLHMRYRWYSADLKQFLSPDSVFGDIGAPSTLNLYAFAGNNPVSRVDPSGELFNALGAAIGAVGGALVGVATQGITDLVTGKTPQWENYAAAAVGGAVGGALLGACLGTCGPAALVAAGAASGAIDGALGVTVGAALRGDDPDPNQVLTAALVGGALGGATAGVGARFGGKAGRVATKLDDLPRPRVPSIPTVSAVKRTSRHVRFRKNAATNPFAKPLKPRVDTPRTYTFNAREASIANRLSVANGSRYGFSGIGKRGGNTASNRIAANALSKGRFAPSGRHIVRTSGRRAVNRGRRNVAGEDLAMRRWEVDLSRTGKPGPNAPNRMAGRF